MSNVDAQSISNDNIRTLFTVLAFALSIISFFWGLGWAIYTHKSNEKLQQMDKKRQAEWEAYTKENNKKLSDYTEKMNEKNELLTHLTDFTNLCYEVLISSVSSIKIVKTHVRFSEKGKIDLSKTEYISFIDNLTNLQTKVNVLKTHLDFLSSLLGDPFVAITMRSTYNELYFFVEFIQDILIDMESKKVTKTKVLLDLFNKALKSADELRKEIDFLMNVFFSYVSKYNKSMNLPYNTFVSGTDLFKWYYPQFPKEVQAMVVEKDGEEVSVDFEELIKKYSKFI